MVFDFGEGFGLVGGGLGEVLKKVTREPLLFAD